MPIAGRTRAIVIAVVALVVLGGAGVALGRGFGSGSPSAPRPGQASVPVQVVAARTGPIRAVLTYSGAIQSSSQVNVSPRIAGQLQSIKVEVGVAVKAGDALATLDPGTLPAQLQQAQASLQSAQARLDLMLAGPKTVDVGAAQAALDAAQTKLNQLLNPSAGDIATADSTLAAAQTTSVNADASVNNTKATLLGNIYTLCTSWGGFGVPCNAVVLPLPQNVVDNVGSTLTTGVGAIGSTPATNAIAVLNSNAAYETALSNAASAKQALAAAQAKRDLLTNPSPSDIAAQRSTVEAARSVLEAKRTPYTDADIEGARASVAQAAAALAIAKTNLDQTNVIAPFDGVVAQKLLDPGASVTTQTPVFVLIAKALESHVTVDEARIGQVKPGLDVEMSVPAYPGKVLRGKVATVAPAGDARAHTFDVKVQVADPDNQLKAGMFAQVSIIVAQKADALLVPSAGIQQQIRGTTLFVVANGKAALKVVKVGVTDETNSEILEGVSAGDQVVIVGQNTLRDGQAVQIATPAPGGAGGSAPSGASGAGGGRPAGASGASGASGTSGSSGAAGASGGTGAGRPAASPTATARP